MSPSGEMLRALSYFETRLVLGLDADPPPLGAYRLLEVLGRGSFGRVWRARDLVLERDVAIKVTRARHDESRDLAEARSLAAVSHPHVVHVHAVEVIGGHVVTAMELVEGRRLDEWIASRPNVDDVLRVLHQIGQGLAAIHRVGLAHRDIKPSNIIIDINGNAKIVDLGQAKVNEPIGSFRWSAPEVGQGSPPDHRSDQFSFGLIVKWALDEVGAIHLSNRFADRALRKLPGARWANVSEALDHLPHRHPRRWRLLVASAVLIGVVIGWSLHREAEPVGELVAVVDASVIGEAFAATGKLLGATSDQDIYDGWRSGHEVIAAWPSVAGRWSELAAGRIRSDRVRAWVLVDAAESYEDAALWTLALRARENAIDAWMKAGEQGEEEKQRACAAANAEGGPCQ
jgi:predicted Ser/Thr protein kinase